jgi:DNA-directed RNA polymerase I, II, and III subunit RPABC2
MSDKMYNESDNESDNGSDNESDIELNVIENKPKILKTEIDDADILDDQDEQDEQDDQDDQDDQDEQDEQDDPEYIDSSDDESMDYENENIPEKKINKKKEIKTSVPSKKLVIFDDEDDEDDEETNDNYLEKFDTDLVKSYIDEFHPECLNHNYDEITKMTNVVKNSDGIIIDPFHKTIPFLTKYERARVLGQRAKQIETGAKPFVNVSENIIESYTIAELELKEKKIPFIIKRPIPGGGFEYWNIKDLEIISF